MKKALFILVVAAVLAGCSREYPCSPELVDAVFTVSVGDNTTRAEGESGAGTSVNRCVLQVWDGDRLCSTYIEKAPAGTKEFNFTKVKLNMDIKYDFLFWADCGNADGSDLYYSTASLRNVTILATNTANVDAADAFCNSTSGYLTHENFTQRLVLKRPFAQLNLITEDLQQLTASPAYKDFLPSSISLSYHGCTSYNVLSGTSCGAETLIEMSGLPPYGAVEKSGLPAEVCTLAMAYVIPVDGESVSEVSMSVKSVNGTTLNTVYSNIPLKRNYKTVVHGKLLTVSGSFMVNLNPLFIDTTN